MYTVLKDDSSWIMTFRMQSFTGFGCESKDMEVFPERIHYCLKASVTNPEYNFDQSTIDFVRMIDRLLFH